MTNAEEKIAQDALEQFWAEHKPLTDALGLVNPTINEARIAKQLADTALTAGGALIRVAQVEAKQAAVEVRDAVLEQPAEVKP